jgi:hypothetical protein
MKEFFTYFYSKMTGLFLPRTKNTIHANESKIFHIFIFVILINPKHNLYLFIYLINLNDLYALSFLIDCTDSKQRDCLDLERELYLPQGPKNGDEQHSVRLERNQ